MIPKIIHYCWFGGKPLPRSAKKCIASWRKFFPDYEIKEWNESNFDVNMIPYTAEAYAAKKYAFVSDYARFYVLHEYGGIYFDTDVEVIRPMDDILERGAFMGIEKKTTPHQKRFFVNPGLGLSCQTQHPFWKIVITHYQNLEHFLPEQQGTVCTITTNILEEFGILLSEDIQSREGFTIYPAEYFCPQAMIGAPIHLTRNTRSIHHYDCSWLPWRTRIRLKLTSSLPSPIKNGLKTISKLFK
jgi:mannosyltransferase OCH1-like enzyme